MEANQSPLAQPAQLARPRRRALLAILGLVALVVATYWSVGGHEFIWDDDEHFTANPAVLAPEGLQQIWSSLTVGRYYPLTLTTFWLHHRIWGLDPAAAHALNLAGHALNAVLLFLLLTRLDVPGAWLGAALWAVHPVNVESVAWVTELKNVQSAAFLFGAFLLYWRFVESRRWPWYLGAAGLFAAALLSKPSTVVLPALLLVVVWWKTGQLRRRDLLPVLPFFVLAGAAALLPILEQQHEVNLFGTDAWSLNWGERSLVAVAALWFYAGKLLVPHSLAFIYPRWELPLTALDSWLPVIATALLGALWWRWRTRPGMRGVLVGLGCYAVALSPVLSFFNVYFFRYSFVADHFNYLGSAAFLALVGAGLWSGLQATRWRRIAAGTVLAVGVVLSQRHSQVFASNEALWLDTIDKNPEATIAYNNLGLRYWAQGNIPEALAHLRAATISDPRNPEACNNLGALLLQQGRLLEARSWLRQAVALKPNYSGAAQNLHRAETALQMLQRHQPAPPQP